MKQKAQLIFASMLLVVSPCWAGGTLGTDELVPLMSQQPDVYAALLASFELKDSAYAWVRFGSHYEHLGGSRLGPYQIDATVKASGQKIVVVLCTEATYLDKAGREVPEKAEEKAFSIKEKLKTVLLQSPEKEMYPECH